jgi:hypothetical protein
MTCAMGATLSVSLCARMEYRTGKTEGATFWPCRDENLSPMTGLRGTRSFMLTRCNSSSPVSDPTAPTDTDA